MHQQEVVNTGEYYWSCLNRSQNSQGTCTALASGLVLFGSRPGMPNIESIHGVSQHIDPQVVKSEATHMTGPGSLSLQIIH
jgi:hypothetical protein